MDEAIFEDFLKIREFYKLKQIVRGCSNCYYDEKDKVSYKRKETTAEHIYSCLKLADFFLEKEPEFVSLDKVKVYELLMYHDDIEIEVGDVIISDRSKRKEKEIEEIESISFFAQKLPEVLISKFLSLDAEFRDRKTPESKFVYAIDRLDSMIQELSYPKDWGPRGFTEEKVREWFTLNFSYSKTFMDYFEQIIFFLKEHGYFEVELF